MKTIGMLGGMSWESTCNYYRTVNEGIKTALGGLHSAKIVLYSVDFAEIAVLQNQGRWLEAGRALAAAAKKVEAGGADFLMICCNTMHIVAEQIEAAISLPLLHIGDAIGERLQADGVRRAGLLGTAFTMERPFLREHLRDRYGLDILLPAAPDQQIVHDIIYRELCCGQLLPASRDQFVGIIGQLQDQGAEAIILACTEIAMLVRPQDTPVRLYDTMALHAEAAVRLALG